MEGNSGNSGGAARKHDQFYYFDQLGPKARRMIHEGVTEWDTKWIMDQVNKRGLAEVRKEIEAADIDWIKKTSKKTKHPSTYMTDKIKPLKANW